MVTHAFKGGSRDCIENYKSVFANISNFSEFIVSIIADSLYYLLGNAVSHER